jgi:hypothetical protein
MTIPRSKSSLLGLMALTLVLSIANTVRAQEDPPKPAAPADAQKDKDKEQSQELEKKTLALLNDIASAAWSLKLPENRLFVMMNTADLLWTFDEKRARTLYWEALNSLSLLTPPIRTGESLSQAERAKIRQAYFSMFGLRQRLLRQVAQKDSQLALDMLRASRQVRPQQFGPEFPLPDDRQLEQEIATEVAAHDPARALQVARESLAKGLTFELLNLVHQLNQKDSGKASEFAADIIAKLRTTNIANDLRASVIAVQLLETSRVPETGRSTLAQSARTIKVLSLNDEQKRDLVDVLTNAALTASANTNLLFNLAYIMPEIQQFFPERRAALERKLSAFNETLTKQQRNENTYNTLIRRGMPEELVRVAATANDESREHLYHQAAIMAAFRGTTDSFRDVVSKEVTSEGEQRKILDLLDAEEIGLAANRKQVDQLKKLLPRIRRKEERARAMTEAALILKEKGEDAEAASLLTEAETLIKADLKSETQTNALLTLLFAYAVIEPTKAFALAERTVDSANNQISVLILVDRVVKSGAIKKSEIVLEQAGIMPVDFLVFKYGKGVAALAKADFNRTTSLADRFERQELRILARLLIVKGLLRPSSSTVNFASM